MFYFTKRLSVLYVFDYSSRFCRKTALYSSRFYQKIVLYSSRFCRKMSILMKKCYNDVLRIAVGMIANLDVKSEVLMKIRMLFCSGFRKYVYLRK